jgi:hypothetical protein
LDLLRIQEEPSAAQIDPSAVHLPAVAVLLVQTAMGLAARSDAAAGGVVPEGSPAAVLLEAFPEVVPPEASPAVIPPGGSLVVVLPEGSPAVVLLEVSPAVAPRVVAAEVSRVAMVEGAEAVEKLNYPRLEGEGFQKRVDFKSTLLAFGSGRHSCGSRNPVASGFLDSGFHRNDNSILVLQMLMVGFAAISKEDT